MKKIRIGCFETNSSSYHSMMIVDADVWREFERGNVWLDIDRVEFIHKDMIPDKFKGDDEESKELRDEHYYNTREDNNSGYWIETDTIDTYKQDGTPAVAVWVEISNE